MVQGEVHMKKYYVLHNPLAGHGKEKNDLEILKSLYGEENLVCMDMTEIVDYSAYFANLSAEDEVVLCGGDGTVNHFINKTKDLNIIQNVFYLGSGSGNDFLHDIEGTCDKPVLLNPYLKNLPTVTVKGTEYKFINGVGYGIDGYCCEVGDKLRATSEKPVNYTMIAIKGLLFHYKPTGATVIVDGKEYNFKKVWLAPTMFGKYYGGGMMPTPGQTREADQLSVMLFHDSGKLKTLMIFPSIFSGEHVKNEKYVTMLSGKEITVKFSEPRPLQVDGETILGVTEYTAKI